MRGVDVHRLRPVRRLFAPGAPPLYSCCENSNPNAAIAEKMFGHPVAGIFGYSHLTGGFAGGQAEYVRVPFADMTLAPVPDGLTDEDVLLTSDICRPPTPPWPGGRPGRVTWWR